MYIYVYIYIIVVSCFVFCRALPIIRKLCLRTPGPLWCAPSTRLASCSRYTYYT